MINVLRTEYTPLWIKVCEEILQQNIGRNPLNGEKKAQFYVDSFNTRLYFVFPFGLSSESRSYNNNLCGCIRTTSRESLHVFMHWLGIEPRSAAWEAAMLTTAPPAPAGEGLMNSRPHRHNSSVGSSFQHFYFNMMKPEFIQFLLVERIILVNKYLFA